MLQQLPAVLSAVRRAHPYEETPLDIVGLIPPTQEGVGAGRVVALQSGKTLRQLAATVREHLCVDGVAVAEAPGAPKGVILCMTSAKLLPLPSSFTFMQNFLPRYFCALASP